MIRTAVVLLFSCYISKLVVVFISYCINMLNRALDGINPLLGVIFGSDERFGLVLAKGGKGWVYEEDEYRDESLPYDKGKGKAVEEAEIKPLDKGKGKAVEEAEIKPLDKGKANEDFEMEDYSSGSDADSDEDLNDDIRKEIEYLTNNRSKTKDVVSRINVLKKLLRCEIQTKERPPVPDFWGHYTKTTVKENTAQNPQSELNTSTPTSAPASTPMSTSTPLSSSTSTAPALINPTPDPTPPSTGPTPPSTGPTPPSTGPTPPFTGPTPPPAGPTPPPSDSTPPSDGTPPSDSTPSSESTSSNERDVIIPMQTPTEFVHELESCEPMIFVWDDAD
jgi:hypothetical protein